MRRPFFSTLQHFTVCDTLHNDNIYNSISVRRRTKILVRIGFNIVLLLQIFQIVFPFFRLISVMLAHSIDMCARARAHAQVSELIFGAAARCSLTHWLSPWSFIGNMHGIFTTCYCLFIFDKVFFLSWTHLLICGLYHMQRNSYALTFFWYQKRILFPHQQLFILIALYHQNNYITNVWFYARLLPYFFHTPYQNKSISWQSQLRKVHFLHNVSWLISIRSLFQFHFITNIYDRKIKQII